MQELPNKYFRRKEVEPESSRIQETNKLKKKKIYAYICICIYLNINKT